MSAPEKTLQAIKLKGRIGSEQRLEIIEKPVELPEGDVEIIVLYPQARLEKKPERPSPLTWPTLNGGVILEALCVEKRFIKRRINKWPK